MQTDTGYHRPVHHRKPTAGGGGAGPYVTVSEQSDDASFYRATTYSADPAAHDNDDDDGHPARRAASGLGEWKWELALLVLSVLSLVATAATLYKLQGTRLESWTFFLGLNTVISILAAVSRTSLAFAVSSCIGQAKWNWYRRNEDNLVVFERFDQASKGPWGSARLLGTIWLRHWSALGALIIVVLLAYEPFLQTIITQYGVLDADTTGLEATTGQCRRLDAGQIAFEVGSGTWRAELPGRPGGQICQNYQVVTQPDFGMTAAVYSGFQSALSRRPVNASVSCPTGNCTFPDFASLGVCSRCADISAHVVKRRAEYTMRRRGDGVDFDNMCTVKNFGVHMQDYNYTVFSVGNVSLANHDGRRNAAGDDVCDLKSTATHFATASTANISAAYDVANASATTAFALFRALRAPDAYARGDAAWEDAAPTALECQLSFCVRAYATRYAGGRATERVLGTWAEPVAASYAPLECVADARTWESQFSERWRSGRRADFQVAVPRGAVGAPFGFPDDDDDDDDYVRFNVSQAAVVSAVDWFEAAFARKMIYPGTGLGTAVGVAEILYNATAGGDALAGAEDAFAAVAGSLSAWMRDAALAAPDDAASSSSSSSSSPPHRGVAQRWTIHFGVRWPFLVLPLALELAGALFVVLSIAETRRLGLAAWKDSALATLAYGLDGERPRGRLRAADARGRLAAEARAMRARMDGGAIVHVPDDGPAAADGGVPLRAYGR